MAVIDGTSVLSTHRSVQCHNSDDEHLAIVPWFSYRVNLPTRPLPSPSSRPHIKTARLLVRPIVSADLDAFHRLRSRPETQNQSPTRGRPDRDLDETRHNIELLENDPGSHWYFGAFLLETGAMVGEGGLPDCIEMPRSGWPEAEILIHPDHWRKGLGAELWRAVIGSWWTLPREVQRHQLVPIIAGDREPGEEVPEGVGFVWEHDNYLARDFFWKVLGHAPVAAHGTFVDWVRREGGEGELVRWSGTLMINPTADFVSEKSYPPKVHGCGKSLGQTERRTSQEQVEMGR